LINIIENKSAPIAPSTVKALEGVLIHKDLDPRTAESATGALYAITKDNLDLIREETVKALEHVLSCAGFEHDTYGDAAAALDIIADDASHLIEKSTITALERVLTFHGGPRGHIREIASMALYQIVMNRPELAPLVISSYEGILMHESLEGESYWVVVKRVHDIAMNKLDLIQSSTVVALGAVLMNKHATTNQTFQKAGQALTSIAQGNPELAPKAIETLERVLSFEGSDHEAHRITVKSIRAISLSKPTLILPSTVRALGSILFFKDADIDLIHFSDLGVAVSTVTRERPELFIEVYRIIRQLVEEGKNFRAEGIVVNFKRTSLGQLKSIPGEDWPLILSTIAPEHISLSLIDFKAILLAPTKEEQNLIAISVKQKSYREFKSMDGVELERRDIASEDLSKFIGRYMLPWDVFCKFMDENYDEFHARPEKFEVSSLEEMDMDGVKLDIPEDGEIKEKLILGNIHGLYVRRPDGGKTIYVNRYQLEQDLDIFANILRLGPYTTSVKTVAKFLDGHETMHALIDKLKQEGKDLSDINATEEERLADIFGRASFHVHREILPQS